MDGIRRDGRGRMEGEGNEGREIHKIPYRHFVFPTSSSAQRSEQLYEYGLVHSNNNNNNNNNNVD